MFELIYIFKAGLKDTWRSSRRWMRKKKTEVHVNELIIAGVIHRSGLSEGY